MDIQAIIKLCPRLLTDRNVYSDQAYEAPDKSIYFCVGGKEFAVFRLNPRTLDVSPLVIGCANLEQALQYAKEYAYGRERA